MSESRFDRNERLFGKDGQSRIRAAVVAVVGVGGLGTQVVQQLALLGVGGLVLIDMEELASSNKNRYVGVRSDDPIPGTLKVEVGRRMATTIDPAIRVQMIARPLRSEPAFRGIKDATHVFGCLDSDGERLILNELCCAYARPYIDLASDVVTEPNLNYGGRVCVNWAGDGCVKCLDVLDDKDVSDDLGGADRKQTRQAIYGIDRTHLSEAGPSVVSINGVIASLGVTEFMAAVTGLRPAHRLLTYYGESGKVVRSNDTPMEDCWYCKQVWGAGDSARVERHLP